MKATLQAYNKPAANTGNENQDVKPTTATQTHETREITTSSKNLNCSMYYTTTTWNPSQFLIALQREILNALTANSTVTAWQEWNSVNQN